MRDPRVAAQRSPFRRRALVLCPKFLRDRGGSIAAVTAVILPVLLGFAALAIDMSYAYWTRNELQVTASAAALAGASQLPVRSNVIDEALKFAELNMAQGRHGEVLTESDIEFGFWDSDSQTFTPELEPLNAVKVTTRRAERNNNELDLFLAPAVGLSSVDVAGVAIATFGAATAWDVVIVQDITDTFRQEIGDARDADRALLGCIRDNFNGSQVGITGFTGLAHDLADLLKVEDESNFVELEDSIDGLLTCHQPGTPGPPGVPECSGTHVGAGIEQAIEKFNDPGYVPASDIVQKAIVVVGDGRPFARNNAQQYYGHLCDGTCSHDDLARLAQDQANIAASQDISIYSVFYDEENDDAAADFFQSLVRGDGVFERTPDSSELDDLLFNLCANRLVLRLVQ